MAGKQNMSWRLRLATVRYRFTESLFVQPAALMLVGVVLAIITTRIDDSLSPDTDVPFTLAMSSNAATWLLSTVAGAMITTVGVVFSLTVVSLQLASGQFSPRVMRSFIRDKLSQRVIGLLVATFFYCVLILPNVSGEATDPAPQVSLTVAVLMTLVTVIGILAHLDHLAHGLQVGNVARVITAEGIRTVNRLEGAPRNLKAVDIADFHVVPDDALVLPARSSGWVTQVDTAHLFKSIAPGTRVRLETRIGAYIHAGEPLLRVWPAPGEGAPDLGQAVEISATRAMLQDADFAIRQLVDIGLRALSPSINDPTTAIEVVLRLGTLLRTVLTTPLAPEGLEDPQGRVVVQPWNLSHEEFIDHAFDQMRLSTGNQTEVIAALLRVLRMLIDYVEADHPEHLPALERQSQLILDSLPADLPAEDLARLRSLASDKTDPADHSR